MEGLEEITERGIEKEPCFFVLKQGLDALLTFMLSSVFNHLKVAVFLLPQGPDTQNWLSKNCNEGCLLFSSVFKPHISCVSAKKLHLNTPQRLQTAPNKLERSARGWKQIPLHGNTNHFLTPPSLIQNMSDKTLQIVLVKERGEKQGDSVLNGCKHEYSSNVLKGLYLFSFHLHLFLHWSAYLNSQSNFLQCRAATDSTCSIKPNF